jgi:selenocysteine lyase/cysteine desulfurase
MSADFAALRRRFPLLERKSYLNSGSYGALADTVQAAVTGYLEERLLSGANWDLWVGKNEAVRALLARLLGAHPDEVAVTASASAAINALASACDFSGTRNKVVVSDFEFPTNAQIWHAQERRGARVVHVAPAADGYIPLEAFAQAIDAQTQLVAVTQVCYRNGALLDIAGIARLAHARGAKVMVDCYQAVGALAVDVKRLDVDFAVGGMVKYLLGTAGLGFLYARAPLIGALLPTDSGWFAQEDIGAMDITANRPARSARRFEAGTPAVINCYAAEAGLKIIHEVGAAAIESRVRFLAGLCMQRLEEIGWPSITPPEEQRHGPLVCVAARDVGELCAQLGREHIVTSYRDDKLRAGFHFYNSEEDVERFVAALSSRRERFQPTGAHGPVPAR